MITLSTSHLKPSGLSDSGIDKAESALILKTILKTARSHFIDNALRYNYIHDFGYRLCGQRKKIKKSWSTNLLVRTSGRMSLFPVDFISGEAKEVFQFKKKPKHLRRLLTKTSSVCTKKLSGMTGTGKLKEEEFIIEIYNVRGSIPTNRSVPDHPDLLWRNQKFQGCCGRCQSRHEKDSQSSRYRAVETSDYLSQLLGSKQIVPQSFECENHWRKRKLSRTLVNVVLLPLLPTWPDVVPTSSLVKVFLELSRTLCHQDRTSRKPSSW